METEVKFKVNNEKRLKQRLKKAGAEKLSYEHEQDFYFDDKKRTLRKRVVVLRVRKVGAKGILTMKYGFKKFSKRFKIMNEIEVPTNDFKSLRIILEKLGYRVDGFKEKRRQTYRLRNVNILIDRLPFLGAWMEIEGRSRSIEAIAKKLNLRMKDSNNLSYGQLFLKFCRDHSRALKPFEKRVDIFSFECEKKSGLKPRD